MHHPAQSITKLNHCGKHDNTGEKRIPMYYSTGEEAVLVVIDGGADLSVCQRVDEP